MEKKKKKRTASNNTDAGHKNSEWALCQALSGRAVGAAPSWGTAASPLPSLGSSRAVPPAPQLFLCPREP